MEKVERAWVGALGVNGGSSAGGGGGGNGGGGGDPLLRDWLEWARRVKETVVLVRERRGGRGEEGGRHEGQDMEEEEDDDEDEEDDGPDGLANEEGDRRDWGGDERRRSCNGSDGGVDEWRRELKTQTKRWRRLSPIPEAEEEDDPAEGMDALQGPSDAQDEDSSVERYSEGLSTSEQGGSDSKDENCCSIETEYTTEDEEQSTAEDQYLPDFVSVLLGSDGGVSSDEDYFTAEDAFYLDG
ncbi:hypothetical protein SLS55_007738 [Diplodia seriata]|uniref:Uncharacterized protein n=1 Tax=Diplodia seriata TaxID=420778 RepID=A0ABR3CBU8_9PEZI